MKNSNRKALLCLFIVLFLSLFLCLRIDADVLAGERGTRLPKILFRNTVSNEAKAYLGLPRTKDFSLSDIGGSLYVIEVFSAYCTSCPKNVPILNEVYRTFTRDAITNKKVKIFGIAIGNTEREIEQYRAAHHVAYPILSDSDFSIHRALGNPRVPYTMFVKRTPRSAVLLDTHQGVLDTPESVIKKVRAYY